mmetsp:Transcript_9722/g.19446  ORF Transcript_9722/g.19446 Transcript_9722/m.19446 type:complete len:330 (+) Transcript_9722:615-1604(+)
MNQWWVLLCFKYLFKGVLLLLHFVGGEFSEGVDSGSEWPRGLHLLPPVIKLLHHGEGFPFIEAETVLEERVRIQDVHAHEWEVRVVVQVVPVGGGHGLKLHRAHLLSGLLEVVQGDAALGGAARNHSHVPGDVDDVGGHVVLVLAAACAAAPDPAEGALIHHPAVLVQLHLVLDYANALLHVRPFLLVALHAHILIHIVIPSQVALGHARVSLLHVVEGLEESHARGLQAVAEVAVHVNIVSLAPGADGSDGVFRERLWEGSSDSKSALHGAAPQIDHGRRLVRGLADVAQVVVRGDPHEDALVCPLHHGNGIVHHLEGVGLQDVVYLL